VLAIEPQDYRPATVWSSWATHAPEPAVTVRGICVLPDRRAVAFFAGDVVRRHAVPSRAPSFQGPAPGGMARPRVP
jgi:hypothetical protein